MFKSTDDQISEVFSFQGFSALQKIQYFLGYLDNHSYYEYIHQFSGTIMMHVATRLLVAILTFDYVFISSPCHEFCFAITAMMDVVTRFPSSSIRVPSDLL